MKRVNTFVDYRTELVEENSKKAEAEIAQEKSSKRAREELEQESSKKHKVKEDTETSELQCLIEIVPDEEEVEIDAIPLATKPPTIVDWNIYKEGKKSYYQIIRADGKVESFRDEESLGEDASKQGRRITDIDDDEDITLVNDQIDADAEMFCNAPTQKGRSITNMV
ncbi:hypothetical protein Tco_1383843 [Tanacetum coccineum]